MPLRATPASAEAILPWRERYRREMACQVVHDSIHRRSGWTRTWQLHAGDSVVGFGSIAVAGPWADRPTIFEFDVVPEHRTRAFALFEVLLAESAARFIETQTNDTLLTIMLHAWSRHVTSEKIIFRDDVTTTLSRPGATLRRVTSEEQERRCFAQRHGGSEWLLELDGTVVGQGGILFHYNPPYGDIHMKIADSWRRRGLGSWFVQELKRACRDLGGIPAARCNPDNIASRQTCQKAGFIPCGHLLSGPIDVS